MISQPTSCQTSETPEADAAIPLHKRIYFQERLKSHIHELVYDHFRELEKAGHITRADLARRTGKRPEQITRLLNTSGNLRLETVSDLLLGMDVEPCVALQEIGTAKRNYTGPEWLCSKSNAEFALPPHRVHYSYGCAHNTRSTISTENNVVRLEVKNP